MTAYVISSLAWALLGFVVGWAIGRVTRAAALIEEAAMTEPTEDPPPVRVTWWARVSRRPTADQLLGLVVVILAVASVIVMAVSVSAQQAEIERAQQSIKCQTRFNQAFAGALNERTAAAARERDGQAALLDAIVLEPRDRARTAEAIKIYRAQLEDAKAQRAANPLPEQPSCEVP